MLVEFRFSNYRSFKDEQSISMVASSDNSLGDNLIKHDKSIDLDLLRSVVVYGANAAGKTAILDAIHFIRSFVRFSAKASPGEKIKTEPFLLDSLNTKKPSTFEVIFIHEKIRYQYGFTVNRKKVFHEWLISYPKGRARRLFDRQLIENKNVDEYDYSYSAYFSGEKDRIAKLTKSNALYLSVGATFNHPELSKVYNWFSDYLIGIKASYGGRVESLLLENIAKKETQIEQLKDLLNYADFGVVDISISEDEMDFPEFSENEDDDISPEVSEALSEAFNSIRKLIETIPEESRVSYSANLLHKSSGEPVLFPYEAESAGTRQFLVISAPIIKALNNGSVVFVDELDRSLHPLLVQVLINLFHDPSINKKNAQLIFNTHDTTLLGLSLFRRDQICFVEKDEFGASHLYSLLEFSPRKSEAIEKGYLQGRYGAVPFLGQFPKDVFVDG